MYKANHSSENKEKKTEDRLVPWGSVLWPSPDQPLFCRSDYMMSPEPPGGPMPYSENTTSYEYDYSGHKLYSQRVEKCSFGVSEGDVNCATWENLLKDLQENRGKMGRVWNEEKWSKLCEFMERNPKWQTESFNALKKWRINSLKEKCVQWIRDFFEENGPDCNAVVGISGGKDSSVVAALCVEALGRERVIGVLMPNGEQADIDMAKLLVEHLGIRHYVVNIKDAVDGVVNSIPFELSKQSRENLPPRIRMATLYAVSQSHNGRVANTCNLSEDWVGYATRYGDSVGDFSPCSRLTVQEVKAIGRLCGLPDVLVDKVPIDGLCGKTDEDNLGFTYAVLDRYIRTGEIDDPATKERIDGKHRANLFKLRLMPAFDPVLPTIKE